MVAKKHEVSKEYENVLLYLHKPRQLMVIRRHTRASGWIQTASSGIDIFPSQIESLFNCSVNQEMAVKASGPKSGIDFKLSAVISYDGLCHFAVVGITNGHSNDKAVILDLLNSHFPFEFMLRWDLQTEQ